VERVIQDTTYKKVTEDDDVSVDVLKVVGGDGLRIIKQLFKNVQESGECPKDNTEVK
jgi:hypothetical protein